MNKIQHVDIKAAMDNVFVTGSDYDKDAQNEREK